MFHVWTAILFMSYLPIAFRIRYKVLFSHTWNFPKYSVIFFFFFYLQNNLPCTVAYQTIYTPVIVLK